jgi:hypothetical protein
VVEDENQAQDYEIFEQVIERYGVDKDDIAEPAEEAIIEDEEENIMGVSEAIRCLERLKLFELRQEDGSQAFLRSLEQADRRYFAIKHESKKQSKIDGFFQKKQ